MRLTSLTLAALLTTAPAFADDRGACVEGIAMIKAELARPAPEHPIHTLATLVPASFSARSIASRTAYVAAAMSVT